MNKENHPLGDFFVHFECKAYFPDILISLKCITCIYMNAMRGSAMVKFLLVLIVLLVLGIGVYYGYLLYTSNQELTLENQANQEIVTKYQQNTAAVSEENSRCEMLIASGTGVFGDFAYCERFLEWSKGLE